MGVGGRLPVTRSLDSVLRNLTSQIRKPTLVNSTGLHHDRHFTTSMTSPHRERPRPIAPHGETLQYRRPIRIVIQIRRQIDQIARGHRRVVLVLRRLRVMIGIESLRADRRACASIAVREVKKLHEAYGIGVVDQDHVVKLRGRGGGVRGVDVGGQDVFDAQLGVGAVDVDLVVDALLGGGAGDKVFPEDADGAGGKGRGVEGGIDGVVGDVGKADGEELWGGGLSEVLGEGGETYAVGCDGEVSGSLFVELDGEIGGDVRSNVVVFLPGFRVSISPQFWRI